MKKIGKWSDLEKKMFTPEEIAYAERMAREEFWHRQHESEDPYWLTGTNYGDLLSMYEMEAPRDLRVTEIGVGLCTVTRELTKSNNVFAIDIADVALKRAMDVGASVLYTRDLGFAHDADLVICHLVFQHCNSAEVRRLLSAPLKLGGIYACQTAYLLGPDDGQWDPLRIVWHPEMEILESAKANGLTSIWSRRTSYDWEGSRVGWTCFKFQKDGK